MKHVVIVGGGFAGLSCAQKIAAHPDARVILIDRNNYHHFQPLLHPVATGCPVSQPSIMIEAMLRSQATAI